MSKFVGRRGVIGIAKEAVRGSGGTAPTFYMPRTTISFDDKTETAREQEALGVIADSDALFVTQKMAEGDVEFEVDDRIIGIILTSLLGASPSKSGSNPYTYTYTLSQSNQHQSLSILYQDPDFTKIFPLAVVDAIKITIDQNAIVKCSVTFKSRVSRDWTTVTADFTALGSKFLHQHLAFRLASTVGGLAASTPISVKSLELNIKANTVFDTVLGTVEPEDILNGSFAVEGNVTLNKQDDTFRQLMLQGTYKAMDVTLSNGANSSLQFQFPRVDFTEWEQDRTLDDIVSQKINFKGNRDTVNGLDIISTCILINTLNSTNY